jgi:hypothetical protein
MANLVALFYNWWNLYLRFYDEEHHREAIRSRPMLIAGVGRQVVMHDKGDLIADHEQENMGLTSWEGAPQGKIHRDDVSIVKNYLSDFELGQMQRGRRCG